MKKIEYRCDVCGDLLRKERMGPDERPFVSFEFGNSGSKGGARFVVKQAYEVERHICLICLEGLAAMASWAKAKAKAKG